MRMANPITRKERGYIDIQDHGLIGNMRTAALISLDGSVESYCVPHFDSPSIFARILDKDKGGHFSIYPDCDGCSIKQAYLPNSNILTTKFLHPAGVAQVSDFLPLSDQSSTTKPLLSWLIRRVEVIRGRVPIRMECAPAFNYARSPHTTAIIPDMNADPNLDLLPGANSAFSQPSINKAVFDSPDAKISLDIRYVPVSISEDICLPKVALQELDLTSKGHLGLGVCADMELEEGQIVWFILRVLPESIRDNRIRPTRERAAQLGVTLDALIMGDSKLRAPDDPILTHRLLNGLFHGTNKYWTDWILRSTYQGMWREAVHRSALALKLLIFEPTGAIVASPTFSLPEMIGGTRNWDYRYSWIRDSSFTLYALIRLGFTQEANAYMEFIFSRLQSRNPDGSLQIMYSIHGGKDLEEVELSHLDGHKGSKPVRIGNGAADHVQLDIYGELISPPFGKPLSYDIWVAVRELADYVVDNYNRRDLSIWEVRGKEQHFTYSKVMMWVAIDRSLRLAEKRSFPCPNRQAWYQARDQLYEDIMTHAWNPERKFFSQSYDDKTVLDSAVLIMPLVFFCSAADERFLGTLNQILKSPEKGGLTANNLVYRYDVTKTNDGVGGDEGTFCLCTLWAIEALTRAGQYDPVLLSKARSMFEDFLQYTNHLGLCTEEIGMAGEGLGNAVQGFTHVTLISAAYNLSRTVSRVGSS